MLIRERFKGYHCELYIHFWTILNILKINKTCNESYLYSPAYSPGYRNESYLYSPVYSRIQERILALFSIILSWIQERILSLFSSLLQDTVTNPISILQSTPGYRNESYLYSPVYSRIQERIISLFSKTTPGYRNESYLYSPVYSRIQDCLGTKVWPVWQKPF